MMTCSGDTVSGTKKRESRSEAFIANPFTYTFVPVPLSDDGAIFLDMSNLQFSVNKDSKNLDMANEFMRFLITSSELSEMAQKKDSCHLPKICFLTACMQHSVMFPNPVSFHRKNSA